MNSVQTKETPTALANLLKAKGQRSSGIVQTAAMTVVDAPINTNAEVTATPEPAPEPVVVADIVEDTPAPVVQDTLDEGTDEPDYGRDSEAYRNLKTHHDKTVYELRQEKARLESQVEQLSVKKVELPKSKEEIQAFKESNKDAYDIMRSVFLEELENSTVAGELKSTLKEIKQETAKLEEKKAFDKLLEFHPDALEIKKSPKFKEWFMKQPLVIRDILAHGNDIEAVAKQLTLYKIETGITTPSDKKKATNQQRVDASIGVDVKGRTEVAPQKKIWTKTEIDKICSHYPTYTKYAKEIDAARREGRVDMSK